MARVLTAALLMISLCPPGCSRADDNGAGSAGTPPCQVDNHDRSQAGYGDAEASSTGEETLMADDIRLIVVYDNNEGQRGLEPAWGFGCVIEVPKKTILFDTGGDGAMLLNNMSRLGIDPEAIDVVVLSHHHQDHTGGLAGFLGRNPSVEVYMPASFPEGIKKTARDNARGFKDVTEPTEICPGVMTTAVLSGPAGIDEQALLIATDRGTIVITGCAHPGIADIVGHAGKVTNQDVLLVMGGFHLIRHSRTGIGNVVSELESLGVEFVGPCHCTGDIARDEFKRRFEDRFVQVNLGSCIEGSQLNPKHN